MRSQIYTETACALAVARDPSFFGRRDCINPRMFCDTRRSSETKSIHLCDISCKQRSFVSVGHQFSDSRYGPVKLPTAAFMSPAPPSVNKRSSMRLPNLYNDHYIDITAVSLSPTMVSGLPCCVPVDGTHPGVGLFNIACQIRVKGVSQMMVLCKCCMCCPCTTCTSVILPRFLSL